MKGLYFLTVNGRVVKVVGSPWHGTSSFLQKPITASTNTLRSSCGIDIYLKIRQRQNNKRCKKGMVPIP